jgi:hypothetical protein
MRELQAMIMDRPMETSFTPDQQSKLGSFTVQLTGKTKCAKSSCGLYALHFFPFTLSFSFQLQFPLFSYFFIFHSWFPQLFFLFTISSEITLAVGRID